MAKYPNENRWDSIINEIAPNVGVEPALVKSIIGCESGFKWIGDTWRGQVITHPSQLDRVEPPSRVYPQGTASVGPMQVTPEAASMLLGYQVKREDLYDPWQNIYLGSLYLASAQSGMLPNGTAIPRRSTVRDIAAAYNAGLWVKAPWPSSTATVYVPCVEANYVYFANLASGEAMDAYRAGERAAYPTIEVPSDAEPPTVPAGVGGNWWWLLLLAIPLLMRKRRT